MKPFFLLLTILFLPLSPLCAQSGVERWPNGKLKSKGDKNLQYRIGKWKEYDEHGKLSMKGEYAKGRNGFYDGTITGYYPDGKKRYEITYASQGVSEQGTEWYANGAVKARYSVLLSTVNKAEVAIHASFFHAGGNQQSELRINTGKGVYSCKAIHQGDSLKTMLRATASASAAPRATEFIKTVFFDSNAVSMIAQLRVLNGLFGNMGWLGKTDVVNPSGQLVADSTYVSSRYCYSYQHTYLADTLAYSSTELNGKTYYVFPGKLLRMKREIPKDIKHTPRVGKADDGFFVDFYHMPEAFPDGTWLMFYSKKTLPGGIYWAYESRFINDTSRYLFSPCRYVYFQVEYKNHKPHGTFREYFFESTPDEYVNSSIPSQADLCLPFQCNILRKSAEFDNGIRNGPSKRYLLDGKTAYYFQEYRDDVKYGQYYFHYHNDSLTRISPYFSEVFDYSGVARFRKYRTYFSPISNQCIGTYYPAEGVYCFYQEGLIRDTNNYTIFHCVGTQIYYADEISNTQYVIGKDSVRVACYIRSYYDTLTMDIRLREYRHGKIYREFTGNERKNRYKETFYSEKGIPKTEYFYLDERGARVIIKK